MFDHDRLRSQGQRFLPLLLALWLAALIPAAKKLLNFEWTSGAIGVAPPQLSESPSNGGQGLNQRRDSNQALLFVAIHPLCSCTRATLRELEDSAPNWKQPYHATFLIYKAKPQETTTPANPADSETEFDWHRSTSIRDAQRALNADVIEDLGGEQASRLGALTSGEVLLYSTPNALDAQGLQAKQKRQDKPESRRLLFSGGVTPGRGMEGENGGIAALGRAINSSSATPNQSHAPVYGCGLASLSASSATSSPGGPSK